jgi:hypothetical protein
MEEDDDWGVFGNCQCMMCAASMRHYAYNVCKEKGLFVTTESLVCCEMCMETCIDCYDFCCHKCLLAGEHLKNCQEQKLPAPEEHILKLLSWHHYVPSVPARERLQSHMGSFLSQLTKEKQLKVAAEEDAQTRESELLLIDSYHAFL